VTILGCKNDIRGRGTLETYGICNKFWNEQCVDVHRDNVANAFWDAVYSDNLVLSVPLVAL